MHNADIHVFFLLGPTRHSDVCGGSSAEICVSVSYVSSLETRTAEHPPRQNGGGVREPAATHKLMCAAHTHTHAQK